jgi:hypothetical protein
MLLAVLGQRDARLVFEEKLTRRDSRRIAQGDVIFFGWPEMARLKAVAPQGQAPDGADTLFTAASRDGRGVALFAAAQDADPDAVLTAARKMTHYGKYGRLAFRNGANVLKDTPEPAESPLLTRFEETR